MLPNIVTFLTGVSLSTARWLVSILLALSYDRLQELNDIQAPTSFFINFAAQQYGMRNPYDLVLLSGP